MVRIELSATDGDAFTVLLEKSLEMARRAVDKGETLTVTVNGGPTASAKVEVCRHLENERIR